jgi:HD-like signal output (HDOD) protein
MRFFRSETPEPPVVQEKPKPPAPPVVKLPSIQGWSEADLLAVYNGASGKSFKTAEPIFSETEHTDSFFIILDGAIQVTIKLNGQPGGPAIFERGDCIAPLPPFPGMSYCAHSTTASRMIEISPTDLTSLPANLQVCIYKAATASTSGINAYVQMMNAELSSRNLRLSQYILNQNAARGADVRSDFVQTFIRNVKQLPPYAKDFATKLLDDRTTVQEVVEGIRSDPALVALVLRTVNSAQYGFAKKIESFYHACMILGFNNIYNLLMQEAAQSAIPITRETTRIHKHSCLISVLCFEIVSIVPDQQAQTAATIGVLHDLGKGIQGVMRNANAAKADFIDTLDSSRLGATLLRSWGIPERICKIVEFQHHAEFMPPELVAPEFRREIAALHISHVLEMLMTDKPLDPSRSIYTAEYMAVLGFGKLTPAQLLEDRIMPALTRNRARVPPEIHSIVFKGIPLRF